VGILKAKKIPKMEPWPFQPLQNSENRLKFMLEKIKWKNFIRTQQQKKNHLDPKQH